MTTTVTKRVTAVASGGQTKRITEGVDIAGIAFLLLEGDMQTGGADRLLLEGAGEDGHLLLEGDGVPSTDGTTLIKRVTAAASGGATKRVAL